MERARKMVLVSAENFARMEQQQQQQQLQQLHQQQQQPAVLPAVSANNDEGTGENTVRTPGTVLLRLDAEMRRILDSTLPDREKWGLYRETLQRYLHFFREEEKNQQTRENVGVSNDVDVAENNRPEDDGNDNVLDDEPELDRRHRERVTREAEEEEEEEDAPTEARIDEDNGGALSRPVGEAPRRGRRGEQKSIRGILDKIPKSYRGKARKLLRHLCDVAVPVRISWDRQGVVSIDGNVLKGTNIAELVNDAVRERKTLKATGRGRFARLLRDIATPPEFVGNRELREKNIRQIFTEESPLRDSISIPDDLAARSSTPIPRARARADKRSFDEASLEDERDDEGYSAFITGDGSKNKTRVSDRASKLARKRRLLNWNLREPLGSSAYILEGPSSSSSARKNETFPGTRATAGKRGFGETSFEEERDNEVFISSNNKKNKMRVSDRDSKFARKRRLLDWNLLE